MKVFFLLPIILLVGCVSEAVQEQRKAQITLCEYKGGKAYTAYGNGNHLVKCAMPDEQARLERLELACVQSGGIPKYHIVGEYYENCRRPAAVSNEGGSNSGFKPYCPPSKTPIYGCPPPTPVIIVD